MAGPAPSGGEEEHPVFELVMGNEIPRVREALSTGYDLETRGSVRLPRARPRTHRARGATRRCASAVERDGADPRCDVRSDGVV